MRLSIAGIIVLTLFLFSCKHTKTDMVTGTWKGANFENPDMDDFFKESQHYIDTLGSSKDARTNWELYGVTNMDSLKKELQNQHDSAHAMQRNAVLKTIFNFKKDSVAVVSFNGSLDTSKWYLKGDTLVMIEMTGPEQGMNTQMQILALSETEMKLKFEMDSSYSTVTFVKQKN